MTKRKVILLLLLFILAMAVPAAPVSAGLMVTDGDKITSPYGISSPVITVTDPEFPDGGTITIDVTFLYMFVYSGAFTDANVVVNDTAAAATWTGSVSGDGNTLTLISTGGNTTAGENVTVTFTGAGGNPWLPGTSAIYGDLTMPLAVTRTDTSETATMNFWIETPTPPPGGLTVSDGVKITSAVGTTSPVITVEDSDIPEGGTITIQVPDLYLFVNSGVFNASNVEITDTAAAATWTSTVSVSSVGDLITLTSTGGPTAIGENITVTFTGAGGNPWNPDTSTLYGDMILPLTVTRTDTFQTAFLNFMIETTPSLGGLIIAKGEKITATTGFTSPVLSITDADITQDGTITLDVTDLHAFVIGGTLTDASIVINDTAAAATWTGSVSGDTLTLTSTGAPTAINETVTVTFTGAGGNPWIGNTHGNQTVVLTATRTDGLGAGTFNFIIETVPPPGFAMAANFTASPTAELAPLTVAFTDTSTGNATSWNWEFGDGSTSTLQNPDHLYATVGTYTVNLTAGNEYGPDTKTRWDYIHVLNGAIRETNTSIDGLTVSNCGGPQTVTVDTSVLPAALIPNNSVLEIQPPADRGLKNITIYALNGVGFTRNGNLITGNPTSVHLETEEIAPFPGFSDDTGATASFNISIDLSSYPCDALLSTKIWEGVIPEYDNKFRRIADGNNASVVGTAYTANVSKINFPSGTLVKLYMSVNSSWNTYPHLPGAPGMMFIWRIADDGNSGQVLNTTYLYTDPVNNLNYYEAESPSGLSTFGLSSLTGNNNPFQMITLILTEIISPPANLPSSDSSSAYIPGAVATQNTTPPLTTSSIPPDAGKTAKIYTNAKGVVTQATALQSTDGLATVNIGTGVLATDANGKPLSSITIKAIPSENLPDVSPGTSYSFAGWAYELQPDGATFSPEISISFFVPDVQFGQELVVKMFDHASGTWQDVPGSINPETGIITAHISHFCCFALFAETITPETTPASTPVSPPPKANAPVPTAMSTFMGMILWVSDIIQKNIVIFVGIIIITIAIFLHGRKRRRDRLMYLF